MRAARVEREDSYSSADSGFLDRSCDATSRSFFFFSSLRESLRCYTSRIQILMSTIIVVKKKKKEVL